MRAVIFLLMVMGLCLGGCLHDEDSAGRTQKPWTQGKVLEKPLSYSLVSREEVLSEGDYFPCDTCHDPSDEVDTTVRELVAEHDGIALDHGDGKMWCLDCHQTADRTKLKTLGADALSFDESHQVCATCHSSVFKDFERGIHGKRVGSWQGERQYLSCTACHNPHAPAIAPRKPLPPPLPGRFAAPPKGDDDVKK